MSIHVIFGSESGATQAVAERIAQQLSARSLDVRKASRADFETCDLLILGSPTYGLGDLPSDWEDKLGLLESADLSGKRVALFGTGDQLGYPDSFVDAMGILYDRVVAKGAEVVGFTDTAGYTYSASRAERDGRFVGLALDEDGQPGRTDQRIQAWIGQLR